MRLEELLDHISTDILDDRSEILDGSPDSLWSDEALVRYLNAAQNEFCRKAWPIVDATTPEVCQITPVVDQKTYPLHKSIIRVLSVTPADTDIPLVWINHSLIAPYSEAFTPHLILTPPVTSLEDPGRPGWYTTDEETRVLRIRPAPNAQAVSDIGTLNLRVSRYPIVPLSVDLPANSPEIPEEYHIDLCYYAAGSVLMHPNVDSGAEASNKGKELMATFYSKLRSARNDRYIAQNAPGQYLHGAWARSVSF